MTLNELYEVLVVNAAVKEHPYVRKSDDTWVECNEKVLLELGDRIVHDVRVVWEQRKIYVWLKPTNKEIADKFYDNYFKDFS